MNRLNHLAGLFWLTVSIVVCVGSIKAGIGTFIDPGPGCLPFISGVILGIFAIILLTAGTLKEREEGKTRDSLKVSNWSKAALILIPIVVYAIFLSWVGYLMMTFGLMLFLFVVIERSGRLWIKIMIAFITALSSYIVFYKFLLIQLPRGILGF